MHNNIKKQKMQKLKTGTRAGVFFAAAARFIRFIIKLKGKE